MQIQPHGSDSGRVRGLRFNILGCIFLLLLLVAATAFAETVVEPGSVGGPTRFETPDEISGGECSPNAGVLIPAAGLGEAQAGCLVAAAPGGGTKITVAVAPVSFTASLTQS